LVLLDEQEVDDESDAEERFMSKVKKNLKTTEKVDTKLAR
jgi:hypothetical protein